MSFTDQSRRPSPASMTAVVAIHAAVGALLVTGLTVSGAIKTTDYMPTFDLDAEVPPPPPPPPPPEIEPTRTATPQLPDLFVPKPDFSLDPAPPKQATTDILPPVQPPVQPGTGPIIDLPKPAASFSPVVAKPRNNPGAWLSDADYRPNWVRQEMAGTARFRLDIAATGKVSGCEVTGSTGHEELDAATCTLIARRARFEPARGTDGEPVSGSYTGSVVWKLPR